MGRITSHRTAIRNIEIYAIIFPETNQVFIGKNRAGNSYQSYKDHVGGRKTLTKDLFETAKQTQTFPKMYLLHKLETTETCAYRYITAWTKYFLEKGFQVRGHKYTLAYADDLLDETQKIFDQISGLSLDEITSEEKILVGSYTQKKESTETIPTHITVVVTPEEYQHIKAKADNFGMSISNYCNTMAVNGTVTNFTFTEYLDELRAIKRTIREIQLGIYQSGKYFPADLANMELMIERINQNYKHVIRYIDRQFKKLGKLRLGK